MVKVFTCENCSKQFAREVSGRRVYRFCSHSCAVRNRRHANGEVPTFVELPCVMCKTMCTRRVYPRKPIDANRVTCSKKCAAELGVSLRGYHEQIVCSFTCEHCNKSFEKKRRNTSSNMTYQYCSKKCSTTANILSAYASGVRKPPGYSRRRYPAYGYAFRSRLELCYANELVAQGLKPGVDWEYEPEDLQVPYVGPDGEEHTYFPDFRVLDDIVEVKPSSQLDDDFVKAKAEAARLIAEELGTSFYFVTEHDVTTYRLKAERVIIAA